MKITLISSHLLLGGLAFLLPSCGDDKQESSAPAAAESSSKATAEAKPELSTEAVVAWISPSLNLESVADFGKAEMAPPDAEGRQYCKLTYTFRENRYSRDFAPEDFDQERRLINDSAKRAVMPESHYLMQIGAPAEYITEEDRQARPLPEALQQQLDGMTELAQAPVYTRRISKGDSLIIPIRFRAEWKDGQWAFSDFSFDGEDLTRKLDFSGTTPESALPEGADIITPEFIESRKADIRSRADAFNQAVTALISEREAAARGSLAQREAAAEEAARTAAEKAAAEQAKADEQRRFYRDALDKGRVYAGEWTRDQRFGQINLSIDDVSVQNDSVQFFGALSDPKIKGTNIHIEGRCDGKPDEKGCYTIIVTIYDGIYASDQPTAEVFDSSDGYLELKLDPEGRLTGSMSCRAWKNSPSKSFSISLSRQAAGKAAN